MRSDSPDAPPHWELPRLRAAGALMDDGELHALYRYAFAVPSDEEIVEIGSWAGGSATWLGAGAKHGRGAHVTCIDPWEDWIDPPPEQSIVLGDDALAHVLEVTDQTRTMALRAPSLTVAPMWTRPIGMLFIDGLHTYEACRDDLAAWSPKVVPGGVIAVHDFMTNPTPERLERYWWTEGPTMAVKGFADREEWEQLEVVDWTWIARRR